MGGSLRVLVVEDEMLLAMQLEMFLAEAGHVLVGTATSSREALDLARRVEADLALVDIHLADGPTGVEVGAALTASTRTAVVFMTANPKRIPEDFSGAVGVIAKPYTQHGLASALHYLVAAVLHPPPGDEAPKSLTLAPAFEARWRSASRAACRAPPP